MKTSENQVNTTLEEMKASIRMQLEQPKQVETLYQANKSLFKQAFSQLYPEVKEKLIAQIWAERLNYEKGEITFGNRSEWIFIIMAIFIAGLLAKIPDFTGLNPDYFFPRNVAFLVLPFIIAFFAWKRQLALPQLAVLGAVIASSAIYMNFLPDNPKSDTLLLSCIHLPLFLWALWGFTFAGFSFKAIAQRLEFLKFNGELLVMGAVMMASCMALTGISFGLFGLIGVQIDVFFSKYIVVFGLPAVPMVASYIVYRNPQLVNKVSPIIAKLFTPIVLVVLSAYLVAILVTGKDPYNDRNFLLIFNVLLMGVMAIILFSVAENAKNPAGKIANGLVFALSLVTIVLNSIALSAILFRIAEWGITPNRLAVLGSNVLILVHLVIVAYGLFKTLRNQQEAREVELKIAAYLPVYVVWTVVVVFIFPMIFNFQ